MSLDHALGGRLDRGVDRQLQVGAGGRRRRSCALELVAQGVARDDPLSVDRRPGSRPRRPRARSDPGCRSRPCRSPARRARPRDRRGGCRAGGRCPASSSSSISSAVGRSTLRARYSKPESRFEISFEDLRLVHAEDAWRAWRPCAARSRSGTASRRRSPRPRTARASCAVAVVDRAADARDLDHLGLLAAARRPEARRPGRPAARRPEQARARREGGSRRRAGRVGGRPGSRRDSAPGLSGDRRRRRRGRVRRRNACVSVAAGSVTGAIAAGSVVAVAEATGSHRHLGDRRHVRRCRS